MSHEQFSALKNLVDEIGTLVGAGELFHASGDADADDACADAVGTRMKKLANLVADYLGDERPYS